MPANNGPRRASKRQAGGLQNERKRAQNRISQQCLRERHAASARHLESVVQAMRSGSDADSKERYSILLESHMKLIEENRFLEEALFRLRKKLLSMSNSASTAADDPIFDRLLNRESKRATTSSPPAPGSSSSSSPPGLASSISCAMQDSSTFFSKTPPPDKNDAESSEAPNQPGDGSGLGMACLGPESFQNMELLASVEYADEQALESMAFFDPLMNKFGLNASSNRMPSPLPTLPNLDAIAIRSSTVFADKILHASINLIARARDLPGLCDLTEKQLAGQIAVAAVNLLATRSGLESYLYGVNGAHYMEKVLNWRLGKGNRSGVPLPFRPTPLQSSHARMHLAIDFFNWPDLRDQILLNLDNIDLDTLVRDVVLNTVVDLPHRNIAVNVWDLFQNRILTRTPQRVGGGGGGSLFQPDWAFFEINTFDADFDPTVPDPVEEALVRQLARCVRKFGQSQNPPLAAMVPEPEQRDLDGPADDLETPLVAYDRRFRKSDVASFFGLAKVSEWRLSKEFARKYAFLDCSSVAAKCDMAPRLSDLYL